MVHTRRQHAGAAGIAYLVTHVTSVGAVVAYRNNLVSAGVTLEFALAIGCVSTGVVLCLLLFERGPARATTFAILRAVEAAVILAGALPLLATILPGDSGGSGSAPGIHNAAFLLGQGLVISVNTIVLGWLLWDSNQVPRAMAALGMFGGGIVLSSNLSQLWGLIEFNGPVAAAAAMPIFGFEIWLAIHLLARGLKPRPQTPPAPESHR